MITIKYDVPEYEIKVRGKYNQEIAHLMEFIESNHKNAVIEYDFAADARLVAIALDRYIRSHKLSAKVRQRDKKIFFIHKEVK